MSDKRLHSPEPQGSVKRPNQGRDSQAASESELLEQAKELFLQGRKEQKMTGMSTLLQSDAPPEQIQAYYSPDFKELARLITGRDDIPVPPAEYYWETFYHLWNDDFAVVKMINKLINYSSSSRCCISSCSLTFRQLRRKTRSDLASNNINQHLVSLVPILMAKCSE